MKILSGGVLLAVALAGCGKPAERTPQEIAAYNLVVEEIKNKKKSETWSNKECKPPADDKPDWAMCTVEVFDQHQELVTMHTRTYQCSTRLQGLCFRRN